MSEYLFEVQQKNRLSQKGLLKRFTIDCYGNQTTMEKMRAEKSDKYKELKSSKNKKDFESLQKNLLFKQLLLQRLLETRLRRWVVPAKFWTKTTYGQVFESKFLVLRND